LTAKVSFKLLGDFISAIMFLVSQSVGLIVEFEFKHFVPFKAGKLGGHRVDARIFFGSRKISLGRV